MNMKKIWNWLETPAEYTRLSIIGDLALTIAVVLHLFGSN